MKTRLKQLRKELGYTMEKFGERLGLKKSAISLLESGKNNLTEKNIKAVCREFNVNENWLRTGIGEMFNENHSLEEYQKAVEEINLNKDEAAMQAVISYWKMEPELKKAFWNKLLEVAEIYKKSI